MAIRPYDSNRDVFKNRAGGLHGITIFHKGLIILKMFRPSLHPIWCFRAIPDRSLYSWDKEGVFFEFLTRENFTQK
jgi:hypothetical protein